MAECLNVKTPTSLADTVPEVKWPDMKDDGSVSPKSPAPSGVLQPTVAKVLKEVLYGARMARDGNARR
eukprot:9485708-Pyramimonas_sp.AAC.1